MLALTVVQSLVLLGSTALAIPLSNGVTYVDTLQKRDFVSAVGPQLSPGAQIYSPSSPDWYNVSNRWSTYSAPTFTYVVVPETESDITAAISYLSSHNLTFFAQSGGHGYSATLGVVQNAVMINLEQFNKVNVLADGTATVGGAARFSDLVSALNAAGREITVGACPCVGVTGAMIGGGVGRLQGRHGVTSDSLRSARMALWNGTFIDVSATKNADLFYGIRGAGQNFGVITQSTVQTYPQTNGGMQYNADMVFTNSSLESVLGVINHIIPTQDPSLGMDLLVFPDPKTLQLTLYINLVYAGTRAQGQAYANLFANSSGISRVSINESYVSWAQLDYVAAGGAIAAACARGLRQDTYTANLKQFNIATFRQMYNSFQAWVTANPKGAASLMLFEIFGQEGVNAIAPDSSAFPHRGKMNVLGLLEMIWSASEDSVAASANNWAKGWRDTLATASVSGYDKLYVYQNYAHGDEPLPAIYGYPTSRLQTLEALKRKFDPHDNFFGYHNIPT